MIWLKKIMAFFISNHFQRGKSAGCLLSILGFIAFSPATILTRSATVEETPEQAAALRIISRIVEPQHEHVHSSSLAWTPDHRIIAAWYQGSGERTADDTRIMGAVGNPDSGVWGPAFTLADVIDFPDCNPVVFTDDEGRLHLFWITVRGHRWERSLLMHRTANDFNESGQPIWNWQTPILLKPGIDFADNLAAGFRDLDREESMWAEYAPPYTRMLIEAAKNPVNRQEGWMPRNHPIVLNNGNLLLPLYSDGFNISIMALSNDKGKTWQASQPIAGWGPIQPTVIEDSTGKLTAWFRDSGEAPGRVQISHSSDHGKSWTPTVDSDLPNPGSSMEAITLKSASGPNNKPWVAMIYNHSENRRTHMRVALSPDEGKTWPENLSRSLGAARELGYPSMIEGKDGRIHISYSEKTDRGEAIGYESLDLDWILRIND